MAPERPSPTRFGAAVLLHSPFGANSLRRLKRRNYARYVVILLDQGSMAHNAPLELIIESPTLLPPGRAPRADALEGDEGAHPEGLLALVQPWFGGAARVSFLASGSAESEAGAPELLTAAANHGAMVELFTDGASLTEERCRAFVEAGVCRILIPVSSADPAKYQHFHEPEPFAFARLTTYLMALRELKRQMKCALPALRLRAFALRSTLPDLVQLVEYAARMGAEGVQLEPFVPVGGSPRFEHEAVAYDAHRDELLLQQAALRARELGVALVVEAFRATDKPSSEHAPSSPSMARARADRATISEDGPLRLERPCPLVYSSLYIAASGETSPCRFSPCTRESSLGNVMELGVEAVWNGKPYHALREAHVRGEVPPSCEPCVRRRLAPVTDPTASVLERQGYRVFDYQRLVSAMSDAGTGVLALSEGTRRWLAEDCRPGRLHGVVEQLGEAQAALSAVSSELEALRDRPELERSRQQIATVKQLLEELITALHDPAEPPTAAELADALREQLLPTLDLWSRIGDDLVTAYYESQRATGELDGSP